ncbi:hypothetical protein DSM104299_00213 [Baekduia alba]|uniref:tetratricopeptide repeat protein n=1 Tax=Baekduia alba TaxID=2997333 RepID=UPI0023425494|nr:hypothetical protein [Baekduia alba]WCB91542.1 hypothetical protein DSM104299_00213 [Baekduia alba]
MIDEGNMRDARSLFDRGVALGEDGQHEEALSVYCQLIDDAGAASAPTLVGLTVAARYNAAIELRLLGRQDDAMMAFISLINDFADVPSAAYDEYFADARLAVGGLAWGSGQVTAAHEMYDDLVSAYGDRDERPLRLTVANALASKATVLGETEHPALAAEACADAIERLGPAADRETRDALANLMWSRGHWLGAAGRADEAVEAYSTLLETFSDDESPWVSERLDFARRELAELGGER